MNLSRIKDIFLFNPFWQIFPYLLDHIVHEARGGEDREKSAQKLKKSNIPIVFQNLGISQSQCSRLSPIKAASYPRDRSDAERAKDRDTDAGKNQILKYDR